MKIKMLEGFYCVEEMGSDSDYFLQPVCYPMTETMPDPESDKVLAVPIANDQELNAWASQKFVEYSVFEMEVPPGAVVKEDLPYPDAANEAAENVARAVVALYPHRDSLGSQRDALDGIRDELLSVDDREDLVGGPCDADGGCAAP